MSLPELIVAANRQKVASVAQDILDGRIGIIEGSRRLNSLRHRIDVDEFDPDLLTFVVVESETDALPVGDVRRQWASDALAKKDVEIAAAEAFYRKDVLESCSRLVARFAPEKPPGSAYDYYTPDT
jgi:hypothetical protein